MGTTLTSVLVWLAGLAAAAGLAWLVMTMPPTRPNLALFFGLLIVAATGLLAPALAWLHRRIPFGGRPPAARAALRQAFLISLALAAAALLLLADMLDAILALGIAALVVLVEILAQSRAR